MSARTDGAGIGIAVVGHAAVIAMLYFLYDRVKPEEPEPVPMEVSFVEEIGPVSTAPQTEEAPAPAVGEEFAPAEEASGAEAAVPDPIRPPIVETVRPPVETSERGRPDNTRSRVQVRPAAPPRVADVQPPRPRPPQSQPRPGPPRRDPAPAPGSRLPSRDSFNTRGEGSARQPSAPVVTAQARTSFVAALGRQIARCSRQQRPPTQEARSLRPVVVIRLRQDGSLDGAPTVRSVEGLTATNRQYETQAREAIVRAIRNCQPYSGLPPELYSVPNGWRQPPPIRLNFQ